MNLTKCRYGGQNLQNYSATVSSSFSFFLGDSFAVVCCHFVALFFLFFFSPNLYFVFALRFVLFVLRAITLTVFLFFSFVSLLLLFRSKKIFRRILCFLFFLLFSCYDFTAFCFVVFFLLIFI